MGKKPPPSAIRIMSSYTSPRHMRPVWLKRWSPYQHTYLVPLVTAAIGGFRRRKDPRRPMYGLLVDLPQVATSAAGGPAWRQDDWGKD